MCHGLTPQCCHRRVNNGASGGRSLSLVISQAQIVATVRRRLQCLPETGRSGTFLYKPQLYKPPHSVNFRDADSVQRSAINCFSGH